MNEEYQKEFFEDFKSKKGNIEKIANKIAERQPKLYLNMPLENVVFAFIIVIMVVIVAFALGVERGKKISSNAKVVTKNIDTYEPEVKIEEKIETSTQEKSEMPIEANIEKKEIVKPYTVQLISYKDEKLAKREKEKLVKEGVNAFIIKSGSWYQLCAGNYENVEEAKKAQDRFNSTYKGCIIKKK